MQRVPPLVVETFAVEGGLGSGLWRRIHVKYQQQYGVGCGEQPAPTVAQLPTFSPVRPGSRLVADGV